MLNLPSVDSEFAMDDDHRNLQPILEHHEEMNDTFLNEEPKKRSLENEMAHLKMEYDGFNHEDKMYIT